MEGTDWRKEYVRLSGDNEKLRAEIERWKGALSDSMTEKKTADLQLKELKIIEALYEPVKKACENEASKRDTAERLYEEARNLNHDLADMVRCLEWTDPKGEIPSHCPWCEVQKPNHDNPCKLKIVIDKGYIPNKRTVSSPKEPEAFVVQLCHGDKADGLYYDGDGDFTNFENACVYYSNEEMERGVSEAKGANEDSSAEVVAFAVLLSRR